QVGVVVHAEPGPRGQPRVDITELAGVDASPQDRLDPSLVLLSPYAELLGSFARERRELVQEDPDVIGVAVDDVEQLVAENGQVCRRRSAGLGDAISAEHDLVHHTIVYGGEERMLRPDQLIRRRPAW